MYKFRVQENAQFHRGYATCATFRQVFIDDLHSLYLLAFLLIGNHVEAEKCFVASFEDAARASSVFEGWERSWSKRCLILNAIQRVVPGTAGSLMRRDTWRGVDIESEVPSAVNAVSRLAPLHRFVFVMSVLEKYSDCECSLLLGCALRDVVEARIEALWQISGFDPATQNPLRLEKMAGTSRRPFAQT
jgi:DNA-directed RNA polymerase specialized sigma24 family protein